MVQIPKHLRDVLREVLTTHQPSMLAALSSSGELSLNSEQREALFDSLAQEFCARGLMPDDEPNARGLALEELMDLLGKA